MAAQITTLIDKVDNFELIRDQIAAILVLELANQQVLAPDPDLYDIDVYVERSQPFENYLNGASKPLVNVFFDSSTYNRQASNTFERQQSISVFNIDCYGYGQSVETIEGHAAGDRKAAQEAQRCFRLVRNILMAGPYNKLGLLGLVGDRWPQAVTQFQPQFNSETAGRVVGMRLALEVRFNEFAPEYVPENLEYVSIDFQRQEDGLIIMQADYSYI